jgi:hypothetical protein
MLVGYGHQGTYEGRASNKGVANLGHTSASPVQRTSATPLVP